MADTCPDCGRPKFTRSLLIKFTTECAAEIGDATYEHECQALTITRLRARLAELEHNHAEQVAEREHLDAIYRSAKRALASHQFEKLEDAKRHIAALEAERSRQAKGAKREGSG